MIKISSADGRGADSTVKRGLGIRNTLGKKPNLAIQTRGNLEIQHAYIRFDLDYLHPEGERPQRGPGSRGRGNQQSSGGNKKKDQHRPTGNVELVLHSVDGSARGAHIRVYGADNPNSELWMDEGPYAISWTKSFSNEGLESLALLADVPNAKLEGNIFTVSTDKLSNFVRTTQLSTVTLIIAGGKNNQAIQFVSRDGNVDRAPVLMVELTGN